jgi:hypothetical protein
MSALVSLLRPGGKLVVADLDGQGLFHYPLPPDIERGMVDFRRRVRKAADRFCRLPSAVEPGVLFVVLRLLPRWVLLILLSKIG